MGDYFLGEIRTFPHSRIPSGWMKCDGSLLNIQAYTALYSLLGTAFGGNGTSTFALPDLRGRTGIGRNINPQAGTLYNIGQAGGLENVAVTQAQVPTHTHTISGSTAAGTAAAPAGNSFSSWGASPKVTSLQNLYAAPGTQVPLNPGSISTEGGDGGHDNMQPFLVLVPCIASNGLYPPRP